MCVCMYVSKYMWCDDGALIDEHVKWQYAIARKKNGYG